MLAIPFEVHVQHKRTERAFAKKRGRDDPGQDPMGRNAAT